MFYPTRCGNRMKKKLRSSRGMTLTEVVMALAIVALLGVALTTGINGAVKVYRDATRLYEAETLCGTILTYLEDEYRFGRNIQSDGTFDSQAFGNSITPEIDTNGQIKLGGSKLLVDTAYTSRLKVSKCDVKYEDGKVTIAVSVSSETTGVQVDHSVTVAPLNG